MNNILNIKSQLTQFINLDKFKEYQHLQSTVENSTEQDKKFINDEINKCCKELLQELNKTPTDDNLKKIVRDSIEKIEVAMLDTEDREFCYELYFKIGEILGIDIEDKTVTFEQKLQQDLLRLAKQAGINFNDFLPPNSSLKKS